MEAPDSSTTFSPPIAAASFAVVSAVAKETEGVLSQVDPFLVEALENPRHRLTVLRMEMDIQRFMQNSEQYQFEFPPFPTSYLRRAAHRVAQHYGLQTMALDNTVVDGLSSRIIARRAPDSRFPAVCLSDVPAKQHETEMSERVKIAIRPRPSKGSPSDAFELGTRVNPPRTVEERKEEYDRARARIFSGFGGPDIDGSSFVPSADGRSSCSSGDEQECYRTLEEIERTGMKDGASRVAIFRDREKDRSDPDYDRSYDRYVRGVVPSPNLCLGGCNVLQAPFLQYEAGYSQMGQLPRNPTYCAFGSGPTSEDAVFVQWPSSPAMVYAHPSEHFRHAIFQVPFYQQPLSIEHPRNC